MNSGRLKVPVVLEGEHFFYKTTGPVMDDEDVDLVVRTVRSEVHDKVLRCGEIVVFSAKGLELAVEGAGRAMRRLADALPGKEVHQGKASILACEWATVHTDDSYAGTSFLSVVLHTGEHPYVMQTLHTEHQGSETRVATTTRVLSKGEAFVFDPTTAHMAAPKYPATGQLLILLQMELADRDETERMALLNALKQAASDEDESNVIG